MTLAPTLTLLVEDDPMMAELLTGVARGAFGEHRTEHATSCASARAALASLKPDLVLLDLGLPDGSGDTLIPALKAANPSVQVIVVTIFDDDDHLFTALRRGADGYMLKDEPAEVLQAQLMDIQQGRPAMSARVARRLLDHFRPKSAAPEVELTARELDVLEHLSTGDTQAKAAAKLGISGHTVQHHVKNLYRKLEVHSRAEMTRAALDRGLV